MRQQEKQEQIMKAAIKRLAHFGVHKTTLSEIAEDVGISKQSLHYYFTDKQTLLAAVIEFISKGYLESLVKHLKLAKDFEEVLVQLVETRYSYFNKYYMVIPELMNTEIPRSPELKGLKNYMRKQEQDILCSCFEEAIKHREVRSQNAPHMIVLVQDILDALFHVAHADFTLPGEEQVRQVMQKQKQVIHLLYRAIAA
jgi:TetR/AcrR family transcriptional regulator